MAKLELPFKAVDAFVTREQALGSTVKWNGWDMVFFQEDRRALRSKNGRYQNGQWGFETVVSPDTNTGKWAVDFRLVKGKKRAARRN